MCSKKCAFLTFSFLYLFLDVFINQCLMTNGFTDLSNFIFIKSNNDNAGDSNSSSSSTGPIEYADLLLDQWAIAVIRDLFIFIILLIVLINHHVCYKFLKFLHHNYINAALCLFMYSYAMVKLLLHADNRKMHMTNVFMLVWNIISGFLYFISLYMLSLLKVFDYKKTNVDGGELENGGDEADIFLDTIKETQRKRVSLFRLFKYSTSDWHYILVGTVFLLGGALAEAFVPYYTGQTLDSILVQQNFSNFKINVGFFILANFLSGFIGGLRTCMFSIAVARLNVRLRRLLFKALLQQDIGFYDKTNTGDMLSRLSTDTQTMSDLIAQNLNGFLWNFVRTVGTMIFIFKLSWQLSLICFIGAPIVFAIGELYGKYYKNLSNKATKRMADSNHVAEETLSTIRTVRSFANEEGEMKRYLKTLKDLYKLRFKQALIFATYDWAVKLSQLFMTIGMFVFGAHLVVTKQITSGDFMSFVIYQLTLGSCLEGLTSVYTGLMSAAGAAEKVFEYLDKKEDPDLDNDFKPNEFHGEIEFKNVTFSYPTRMDSCVLHNVSFTVKPGEVVAIVGPSGSGKSSILSLLERFYKPDSGDILIDGVSLRDFDHKFIHQSLVIVSQEPILYARTVGENIAYGLDEEVVPFERIENAARMANAHTFIMASTDEYKTQCGERGIQLSGGQKQRIAIARALIRNPYILLLDEATSALDSESEYVVQQAIYKNLKGRTVLIVAHRLSTIESADKIIVLNGGTLVEQGTHKELIRKNGLYAHLVNKQLHSKNEEPMTPTKSGASTPKTSLNHSLSYFSTSDNHPTTEF